MNKKLLLAVLLSVFLLKAFAQQDPTNYKRADIIPASPTAAGLSLQRAISEEQKLRIDKKSNRL